MSERESMRALADELKETVVLAEKLHECVKKDPRHASGKFPAARPAEMRTLGELSRHLL
jgi:hypothetical protein